MLYTATITISAHMYEYLQHLTRYPEEKTNEQITFEEPLDNNHVVLFHIDTTPNTPTSHITIINSDEHIIAESQSEPRIDGDWIAYNNNDEYRITVQIEDNDDYRYYFEIEKKTDSQPWIPIDINNITNEHFYDKRLAVQRFAEIIQNKNHSFLTNHLTNNTDKIRIRLMDTNGQYVAQSIWTKLTFDTEKD